MSSSRALHRAYTKETKPRDPSRCFISEERNWYFAVFQTVQFTSFPLFLDSFNFPSKILCSKHALNREWRPEPKMASTETYVAELRYYYSIVRTSVHTLVRIQQRIQTFIRESTQEKRIRTLVFQVTRPGNRSTGCKILLPQIECIEGAGSAGGSGLGGMGSIIQRIAVLGSPS